MERTLGDNPHFRLLVEAIRDQGIATLDPEGRVLSWNAGAERMSGFAAADAVGRPIAEFYSPSEVSQGRPRQDLLDARDKGQRASERLRLRKDGSRYWARVTLLALRDGEGRLHGFGELTRDLTERRAADAVYRLLVESVKDYAIFMLDPDGIVQSWNAGAEAIKGYTADEIVGHSFERFYPADQVAKGHPREELRIAAREGRYEEESWRVRKDGTRFWANVVLTAIRDDDGRLAGYAKVTRDLTERRRSEQELRRAYEELEAFSYSVSHDLRAPLRSLDGFSQVIAERYRDRLDDAGRDYLKRISGAAQRMSRLIDDLLDLSRLGRAPLERTRVDLSEMAAHIAQDLQRADPARRVELSIQPGVVVNGDPVLLHTVLENLLGNAWKYTSMKPEAQIAFGRKPTSHGAALFVRDDGVGFDMAYAGKLFGAFQRLHGLAEFPGTGIGLASVKRIVHRHGGEVWAEGAPGLGATFLFTLGNS